MTTTKNPRADDDAPPWYRIALAELGTREVAGPKDNPRILEYLKHAPMAGEVHDETPWCSAFVNFCVAQAGVAGTRRPNARSWLQWGVPLQVPRIGCVTVFSRDSAGPAAGHVAFYVAHSGPWIQVLGGNQRNSVCLAPYGRERLLGYRWPAPASGH